MQKRVKTATKSRRGIKPATSRSRAVRPSRARASLRVSGRRTTGRAATTTRRGQRTSSRGAARITTDHDFIREWAEERDGHPATVIRTATRGEPGVLWIDFPGFKGEGTLKPIPWDEWLRKFDERGLAFLYQERTANGQLSRFFKLIKKPVKRSKS